MGEGQQLAPSDGTHFPFTCTLGGFILDDELLQTDTFSDTISFSGVVTGTYVFTETLPTGWTLGPVTCLGGTTVIDLAIEKISVTDLQFTWEEPVAGCVYDLHENLTPYFNPPGSTVYEGVSAPHILPIPPSNRFYQVEATCGGVPAGYSNEVGVFIFGLVPGSP